jgi:hypothetical protein
VAKILPFADTEAGRAHYESCLMGVFLQGNRQPQKSLEQKRREGRVLDALEAIGVRPAEAPAELEFRVLIPRGSSVTLELPEFELLKAYVAEAPFPASALPWVPSARQAMRTFDWLETL